MESTNPLVPGWSFWVGSILGGACREPNRAVGVDLILGQAGHLGYLESAGARVRKRPVFPVACRKLFCGIYLEPGECLGLLE